MLKKIINYIGIAILGSGILLAVYTAYSYQQNIFIEATVVSEVVIESECKRPSGRIEDCNAQLLTLHWLNPTNNSPMEATLQIEGQKGTLTVGSRITIKYPKNDPSKVSQLGMLSLWKTPLSMLFYGVLLLLLVKALGIKSNGEKQEK